MVKSLVQDIHDIYQAIHADDPAPDSAHEQQVADAMKELQRIITTLVVDGVPHAMLDTSLFYNWLRLSILGLGGSEEIFEEVANSLHGIAAAVIERINTVVAEVDDPGPSSQMQELGSLLQEAKMLLEGVHEPDLSPAEVEQRARQTSVAIMGFIQNMIDKELHAGVLNTLMLYHWIRVSTFKANVDEMFFQKVERNWAEVADAALTLVEDEVQSRSQLV